MKLLNLSHLRVDLPLFESDYRDRLRRAGEEAEKLGVELEVALILSNAARKELMGLREALFQIKPRVCTWLIFHIGESSTTEKWIQLARPLLKEYAPAAKVGAGTNAYFTEINRGHPPVALIDLVSYSINPQVHAFDDATLVENPETQRITVQNARRIIGDKLLAISPVTLRPRLQPNGSPPGREGISGDYVRYQRTGS